MTNRTRKLMVAAATAASILTSGTSRAADQETFTIVLHVTNHAATPGASALARTQAEIEQIFASIGVRAVWADITLGPDHRACEGLNLFISLLSPYLVQELSGQGVREDVLGSAPKGGGRVLIYTPRVRARAAKTLMDEHVLLGRVIAHEVGHVLLPGSGHAAAGIMVRGINTGPVGASFTEREAGAIRKLLKSKAGDSGEPGGCGN